MQDLYEALQAYAASDWYRFHMPGHKGNLSLLQDIYRIDITEIDGMDDLHHAEGILLEAQRRAAGLFGSEETHYLVGGSTSGILSAIYSACRSGDAILAARNCHKSVYHAIELNHLRPHWLFPAYDSERSIFGAVQAEEVEQELQKDPGIRAVVLTSPTYEGVVSDIRSIAQAAHRHGAVLIVDEAHGAHFGLHPDLPENALKLGADLVICSIHKTLPALTSSALLHVNGPYADRERLASGLNIFQTSSPSYIIMAGMDQCVLLLQEQGRELFDAYLREIEKTRDRLRGLRSLHLLDGTEPALGAFAYDRTRLTVTTENSRFTGNTLYQEVRDGYHLQPEMAQERATVFLSSVADTSEGLERLCGALLRLDARAEKEPGGLCEECRQAEAAGWPAPVTEFVPGDAERRNRETVPLEEAEGRVSMDYAYLYPPGIPILIPGERVTGEVLARILRWRELGFVPHGMRDKTGRCLSVWKNEQ